jgi:hypothetical protein
MRKYNQLHKFLDQLQLLRDDISNRFINGEITEEEAISEATKLEEIYRNKTKPYEE